MQTTASQGTGRAHAFFRSACALAGLLLYGALISPAVAADIEVLPNLLNLSVIEKSGALTVFNGGGETINLQISVKEWTQDERGRDVYSDTSEIVFFPKIMSVEPRAQRAIRVGIKAPPSLLEKTYKLYVEAISTSAKEPEGRIPGKTAPGSPVAFRSATPVFVQPVKPSEGVLVDSIDMSEGIVKAYIRNTGNVHVKLLGVYFIGRAVDGKEVFLKEVAGRYVLQGRVWVCEVLVPREQCRGLASIDVKARAIDRSSSGNMNVQARMCDK